MRRKRVVRKEAGHPDATASKIVHRFGKQGCKREGEHGGRAGSHNGILQQPIECPQGLRSDETTANGEAVRDAGSRPPAKMMPVLVQVQGVGADAERAEGRDDTTRPNRGERAGLAGKSSRHAF